MPAATASRWKVLAAASPVLIGVPLLALIARFEWFSPSALISYDVAVRVVLPVFCLVLVKRSGLSFNSLGFPPRPFGDLKPSEFFQFALLWIFICLTYFLVDAVVQYTLGAPPKDRLDPISAVGVPPLVVIIYYLLSAPFFEEVFYRGVLGAVFISEHALMRVLFIVISAVLFGAAHTPTGDVSAFFSAAYFGALAALLYVIIRNIWLVVIAHFVIDAISLFSSYLRFGTV